MFYNHFIATLYHFFGTNLLNQCPVSVDVFLLVFAIAGNQYQTETKHRETLWRFFLDQKEPIGPELHLGVPRGAHNPLGRAWAPRRALVGCAHLGGLPYPLFTL